MIHLKQLVKTYILGKNIVPVLSGVNLTIKTGEYVAIMGASGSGKSTLLNVLGLLDGYDSGEYYLLNQLIKQLSETDATLLRRRLIGFVFQSFNLIPFKTALENVSMPLYYCKVARKQRHLQAYQLLERVGLLERAHHLPGEMSGGQRQRIAIARALINDPPLILADEPTGNLDSITSNEIMRLFSDIHKKGKTLVVITHDKQIAAQAQRVVKIRDGCVQDSL